MIEADRKDLLRRCVKAAKAHVTKKLGPTYLRASRAVYGSVLKVAQDEAKEHGYDWKPETW